MHKWSSFGPAISRRRTSPEDMLFDLLIFGFDHLEQVDTFSNDLLQQSENDGRRLIV